MKEALRFVHGMPRFGGTYRSSWSGYSFKEKLGYTTGVHTGVDYNGAGGGNTDKGYDAVSIANGIVRLVGNFTNKGYGNTVIIEHVLAPKLATKYGCSSLYSRYMHLDRIDVSVGQEVNVGQRIGLVGNTGTQYAHLHVDVWKSTIGGEKVHLRYDKNTQLQSYLDAFELAEAHKNESEVNKGNEDMIKDGDQDILRIIASEVKGWDFASTHNGSKDATELAAWKGRDFRQLIREGWAEGAWYRNLKNKQAGLQSVVDTLNKELGERPTKAQLEEALAKIQKETDKAIKAEEARLKAMALAEEQSKKYLESLNSKSEDTKLIDSIKEIIAKVVARFK